MINSENINKAYREIMLILNVLPSKYKDKVPKDVLKVFEDNQDINYHPEWENTITNDSSAWELNFLHETITLIAWLNLEYWEESEERKIELRAIYEKNNTKNEMEQIKLK